MIAQSTRKILWLGLMGLFAVILLACGGNNPTPTSQPTPAITASTINPPAPSTPPEQTPLIPTINPPAPATQIASSVPYTYVTALADAYVRTGPGTNFDVGGTVQADQSLPVYGRNQDGSWLSLSLTDTLWIWTELVVLTVDRELIPLAKTIKPPQDDTFTLSPDIAATLQAHSNQETSTARASYRHNATATIRAYAEIPPEGTWCAQNVTRRICVHSFDYRDAIGTTTTDAESRFITMQVEVTNLSDRSIEVYPGYLLLGMIDGIHYPYANETYDLPEPFVWAQLPANETLAGSLVFLAKDELAPVSVLYRDKLAEFEILINLKLPPDTIP